MKDLLSYLIFSASDQQSPYIDRSLRGTFASSTSSSPISVRSNPPAPTSVNDNYFHLSEVTHKLPYQQQHPSTSNRSLLHPAATVADDMTLNQINKSTHSNTSSTGS